MMKIHLTNNGNELLNVNMNCACPEFAFYSLGQFKDALCCFFEVLFSGLQFFSTLVFFQLKLE